MARSAERAKLPRSVIALGVVSLLTDASSEMIFPLLPAFLAARVASAPILLGAMEGLADLVAAGCKWWAGREADRSARLRPWVFAGYGLSSVARPLMAFVSVWWQPLVVRAVDRVGKGIRSAPRDAMISRWMLKGARARAFGFHRGMDHAGAALGALIASGLLALGLTVERVFLLAAIPGALALAAIFFAREPARAPAAKGAAGLAPVPRRLGYYLVPLAMFGLANSTDAFLLLRLSEQGAPGELLPLAWLLLHVVKSAVSFPAGRLADRVGSAPVIVAGWSLYALSYAGLAFSPSILVTFGVIGFYGLYHALSEGAEKALLADLTPMESQGRAFGLYHALTGLGSLAAGVLFGVIWYRAGSRAAFITAGALAALSAGLLVALLPAARGPRRIEE